MVARIEITEENKANYEAIKAQTSHLSLGGLLSRVISELETIKKARDISPELKIAIKDVLKSSPNLTSLPGQVEDLARSISVAKNTDMTALVPKDEQIPTITTEEQAKLNVFARVLHDSLEKHEAKEARMDRMGTKLVETLAKPFKAFADRLHEIKETAARVFGT